MLPMQRDLDSLLENIFEAFRNTLRKEQSEDPCQLLWGLADLWLSEEGEERKRQVFHEIKKCLPELLAALQCDADAAYERDPAAESTDEVILAYPGFYALMGHRTAHLFYRLKILILPRLIATHIISKCSVDIHPGAQIGVGCFIDHGIGIVIGETAIIGRGVTLYQGVTLGASIIPRTKSKEKRHPTLEDGVTVFANACILGGKTVISKGTTISANALITNSFVGNSRKSKTLAQEKSWHEGCSSTKEEMEMEKENTSHVTIRTKTAIPLLKGEGEFISFNGLCDGKEHVAICFGDISKTEAPLVRLHSECLTGDIFGSARCDCGDQLQEAIHKAQEESGIILYLRQEGRGIGLYNKLETYVLQGNGLDTYSANNAIGFENDCRDYTVAVEMLKAMGVRSIRLLSNNPDKARQLESQGIFIFERLSTGTYVKPTNRSYLKAKIEKTHHTITL